MKKINMREKRNNSSFVKRLVAIAIISIPVFVNAQPQSYFANDFYHYNTRNGLSQNDVREIFQDSKGYIWVGTHDGLNRFDGYSFETFTKDIDNENSISSNLISSIAEDSLGNIWMGTDDKGICIYDRKNNTFSFIQNSSKKPDILTSNRVNKLLIDDKGYVWAGSNFGLNRIQYDFENKTHEITHFYNDPNSPISISSNEITSLYQDHYGNVWIGTRFGLNRFASNDNKQGQFYKYPELANLPILDIKETELDLIISAGLLYSLSFKSFYEGIPVINRINNTYGNTIVIADDGNIWQTSNNGIYVYKQRTELSYERIQNFRYQVSNNQSLSGDICTEILKDNAGIIWIGTNGSGLNKYNPKRKNFRHYSKTEHDGSLSHNKIRTIYEDKNLNLWIGTEGGGANVLPINQGKNYSSGFINGNTKPNLGSPNYVYSITDITLGDKNYSVIGGGYPSNLHLNYLDQDLNVSIPDLIPQIASSAFYVFTDKDKNLWVGSYNGGLFKFVIGEKGYVSDTLNYQYDPNNPASISSNIIRSIEQDRDGNMWIGTDKGLCKILYAEINKENPRFIKYFHDNNDPYSISLDYILPITVTIDNQIWIGTLGGGLNKVIKGDKDDNDKFLVYTTKDGLPNNVIKAILEGEDGKLWISSNKGITQFSPDKLEFKNFSINDGLQDMEFTELAAFQRQDGEMIFGGVNGFNAFYPNQITKDSSNVSVVFGDFQILNQSVEVGDTVNNRVLLKSDINQIDKINLKYSENSFSVGFSALHYAAPDQNQYAYKLSGFDEQWIFTSSMNRVAKYTNLSPGDYNLFVKASNNDGYWGDNTIELNIQIEPPIWRTYWAMGLYFLLFATGLWFFRRFTLITITSKNELVLEHMEKEKSEEVNQMKLKFFTNISHEFRTPLTLIIGFVDRLINHSASLSEEDRQKYYQNVSRNSKILLDLINQLLGFRKVEQGKMKLKASYNELTNYINLLGGNFYELANQKNISFNVNFEDQVHTWFDHEILERIIFNLLSNAFKYTPVGGKIDIHIVKNGDYVDIIFEDNGEGIPASMHEQIFERFAQSDKKGKVGSGIGLSFVQSLIHLHHGEVTFDRQRKDGAAFTISLPMDKDVYSKDEILEHSEQFTVEQEVDWLIPQEKGKTPHTNKEYQKDQSLLIVEDNKDIIFFLEENFKSDFNIFTASEGEKALEICLNNQVNLVISDVMMDGMDGVELCEKLKNDERIDHIPIILLTAKGGSDDKLKGYSAGADAYMSKPFSLEELETRMRSILDSRQAVIGKFKVNKTLSPSEAGMTSIDEKFLSRVMSYIEENISSSEFSVEKLARECGLSQLHLNKKLKALVGDTANSFIRNIRLQRATQLLKRNMYSIAEIMYEVGFNDAKYFRDCFKKEYHMTPSEYRKNHVDNEEPTKIESNDNSE
ncbi:MAG: response regulator [Reichenbachiella sp.]